ncbi:MAG: sigma 54-interacting transcriptional regulator [Myxococcales bacterium]|nr:sigma 54-interacting transcriptional regulator [Myxococcales bacterium]
MSQPPRARIEGLPPEGHEDDRQRTIEVKVSDLPETIELEKCKLVVVDGPDRGTTLTVTKPIIRIGTNEKNDLVLNDNTISRFHCEIRHIRDEYLLVDRQSTNGTYIQNLRVREVFLHPNCEVLVGNSLIRFEPEVESVRVFPIARGSYGDLIGSAARMREIYGIIDKVAPSDLSVVVEGETGTGKELVARAIHGASRRATRPLVIFDCSAFPENLLESELFGHEKGAFSGAIRTHRGVFERAEGGTVFFDELGEMSLALQPKFLRALESGEIRRVGGERTIKVDVRVVAATNRNLAQLVEEGQFRRDLFYRLAKVRMTLPPLRERLDDLGRLCEHFLEDLRRQRPDGLRARRFSDEAMELLTGYDWPGNVRELRNVVERSATFCEADVIEVEDLPGDLQARLGRPAHRAPVTTGNLVDPGTGLKEAKEIIVAQFERDYLIMLLERHDMNISRVAREAGIDRRHVYRLMKKYDINPPARSGEFE